MVNTTCIKNECRICFDSETQENLISACNCRGSMKYVHRSCMINWLKISKLDYCNICQFQLWIPQSSSTIKHDGNEILVFKDICPKLEIVRSSRLLLTLWPLLWQ